MRPTISVSRLIDASGDRAWKLITDTRTWPVWGPSVSAVDCDRRFITAGCGGRIRTSFGIWLPFYITAFEDGRYWDWRVAGLPATGHRIDRLGSRRCRLSFTVPAWAFGYGVVCHRALTLINRLLVQHSGEVDS